MSEIEWVPANWQTNDGLASVSVHYNGFEATIWRHDGGVLIREFETLSAAQAWCEQQLAERDQ